MKAVRHVVTRLLGGGWAHFAHVVHHHKHNDQGKLF